MRTTALTLLAAAAAAALTTAQSIPTCANSCISSALPASCNLSPSCICADADFISTISCCVSTACDEAGQEAALAYASEICAPAGVTNLPTAASCASSAAATTSASSVSSASSAAASTSGSAASGSATSALASASSSVSSALASASSAASSVASSATSSAAAQTGAAERVVFSGLGLMGALAGVVMFL